MYLTTHKLSPQLCDHDETNISRKSKMLEMDRNPVPKRRKDAIKPMASEVGSAWMSSLDDLEDSR